MHDILIYKLISKIKGVVEMETLQAITMRKSIRRYSKREVEADKLTAVVNTANEAPKAGTFHITVIQNEELLQKINDATLFYMKNLGAAFMKERASLDGYQPLYGAPVLILFSAPDAPFSQVNCACAATNITLSATDQGLGSCYVISPTHGLKYKPELLTQLNLPEGFAPYCGVLLGYADGNAFSVERKEANNIDYIK